MSEVQIAIIDQENTQIALAVPGVQGPAGAISSGGSANQVFYKVSGTNYDAGWTFIGNANVDAAAAIAGTKISPNFGSQAILTTGTNTAASFSPTSNTIPTNGVYLPAANSVAISTNGSQQVTVNSLGNVGIGVASPLARLDVRGSGPYMYIVDSGANSAAFVAEATNSVVNVGSTYLGTSAVPLALVTGGTERARIRSDGMFEVKGAGTAGSSPAFSVNGSAPANSMVLTSGGLVGIGTSSPGTNLDIVVGSGTATQKLGSSSVSGGSYLNLHGASASKTWFIGANYNVSGALEFIQSTANGGTTPSSTPAMTLDSSGRLGIGSTAPTSNLSFGANDAVISADTIDASDNKSITLTGGGAAATSRGGYVQVYGNEYTTTGGVVDINSGNITNSYVRIQGRSSTSDIRFWINASEHARIDSSGRLLVGTSLSRSGLFNSNGIIGGIQLEGAGAPGLQYISVIANANNSGYGSALVLGKTRGPTVNSNTVVQNGDEIGLIDFQGADGTDLACAARILCEVDGVPGNNDMPGRLVFSTTADGASSPTERMRINSAGQTRILGGSAPLTVRTTLAAGTSDYLFLGYRSATSMLDGVDVIDIFTNGNIVNTNNSYGAISDAKLKENIADSGSQWSDLKRLKVRKYNFKEETGRDVHTQIGLVAQEVELVSPGLVSESPDRDEDGNDLGTVTKSVNYSVLYMKAVKALQEAMDRIEVLEQRLTDAGID